MEVFLDEDQRADGNKRNGKGSKTLKTIAGEVTIDTPADRHSNFEPEIVKKRQRILADNLAPQIISLYGRGLSLRDISAQLKEMYDTEVSASVLSEITDRIIPQVEAWQSRPLDAVYPIAWLDAIHYKVRDEGKVASRAIYNVLAINKEGKKELIGMYVSESAGAKFWLSVLTDLKSRGVKDILIACTDNLSGFSEAILSIFPNNNWPELSVYFKYDEPIRKLIYTTNAVEGFHRQVRKVTKTKGAFTSDMALMKLIYLTTENAAKKWTKPLPNWALTFQQLCIHFDGRLNPDI
jgi:transposase-like protein